MSRGKFRTGLPLKIISVFLLLEFIAVSNRRATAEFLFCYEGSLRRLSEADCENGIVFPRPVTSSCITYIPDRDGTQQTVAKLLSSLCDENEARESEMTGRMAYTNVTFQQVTFETIDLSFEEQPTSACGNNLSHSAKYKNIANAAGPGSDCMEACLADSNSEENSFSSSLIGSMDAEAEELPDLTEQQIKEQQLVNRKFLLYLVKGNPAELSALQRDSEEPRLLKLLCQSVYIMQANCPAPWVPAHYWQLIVRSFKWLFQELVHGEFTDIGIELYRGIDRILRACRERGRTFELVGTICGHRAKVDSVRSISPSHQNTGSRMKYRPKQNGLGSGKYDILLDAAWAAVDFVHGHCFTSFEPDYNLEHVYVDAMESLFSENMLRRWTYHSGFRDAFYWDHLLGTPSTKLVLRNMDACIEASYLNTPYAHRLGRPFSTQKMSPTATDLGGSTITDTWCAGTRRDKELLLRTAEENC